ncbi:SrpA-related protein [hydrothermal vent metagenome]|uniref:SrpA-related protein n=1 Tax=hydrothermal vent metagenome TaxID=652676 RepID=A0A1W1BGP7_9ZZZZ
MQIGSNSLYDIGSSYSIKLNERQTLVVDEDPVAKEPAEAKETSNEKEEKKAEESKKSSNSEELSEDEKRLVKDLAARDSEVKAHEAAHQSAAGGLAGAASYTYQQGPDGKMYAIGGEVPISMPSSSSPEETIQNARKVASAALAAGDPSPQDFSVASSARVMEMQAVQQKNKEALEKQEGQETYAKSGEEEQTPTLDFSA